MELLMRWPQFKAILNEKFYRNYGYTVYIPLLKLKKMDIYEKNMRADYNEVLHLEHNDSSKFFR